MSKLKDKNLDLTAGRIVKIAMKCGRLPIKSARNEWINQTDKIKVPGVTLHMKDAAIGGAGYAELDLDDPADAETYKVFLEWYEEAKDPRIKTHGIRPVAADSIASPMPWWDNSSAKDLVNQVMNGISSMDRKTQREEYVTRCVMYENQRENPRKTLINQLLDLELDGASENDKMAVPS